MVAENAGSLPLIANRSAIGPWEEFQLVDAGGGYVALRSRANNLYVVAENGGNSLIANRAAIGPWERFQLVGGAAAASACGPTPTGDGSQPRTVATRL